MKNVVIGASWRLPPLHRLSAIIPPAFVACWTLVAVGAASAEDRGFSFVERYGADYTAGHPERDAEADPLRPGPLFAVVSIADQHISVYGSDGLIARSPVSTGMRGHSTPTGVFSIVQKRRYHRSNIYSDAPMPFMQRITWSGIALHAGFVPGYPASHGCIRIPTSFAQRLFRATSIGQRVIIAPSDTAPIEIAHANLPSPVLSPAPGVAVLDAREAPDEIMSINSPAPDGGAVLEPVSLQDGIAEDARLNPIEFARAMKSKASKDAKAAALATRAAIQLTASKNLELRKAMRKLAGAENEQKEAARNLAKALRRLEDLDGREAIAEAAEEKSEARAALVEAIHRKETRVAKASDAWRRTAMTLAEVKKDAEDARVARASMSEGQGETVQNETLTVRATQAWNNTHAALLDVIETENWRVAEATEAKLETEAALKKARKAEHRRLIEATEAKRQAKTAFAKAQKAAEEALAERNARQQELKDARKALAKAKAAGRAVLKARAEAIRRLKPLSVFISRKTERLYVRQNFEPLFDVPVSILDAEREIGTHIYVSTHAAEDDSQLYWQAVSMPTNARPWPALPTRKNQDKVYNEANAVELPMPETALGALDRLLIPDDVLRRLAELAWVGATVIISDYGISDETGSTTDFIVLTRSKRAR